MRTWTALQTSAEDGPRGWLRADLWQGLGDWNKGLSFGARSCLAFVLCEFCCWWSEVFLQKIVGRWSDTYMTLRKGSRLCCDQSLISAEVVPPPWRTIPGASQCRFKLGAPRTRIVRITGMGLYIYIYLYISFWQLHLLRPFCTSTVSVIFWEINSRTWRGSFLWREGMTAQVESIESTQNGDLSNQEAGLNQQKPNESPPGTCQGLTV